MADDIIFNKCATIERCVRRAQEDWDWAGDGFETDITRQDAAILNIQRACEAAVEVVKQEACPRILLWEACPFFCGRRAPTPTSR